MFETVWTHEDKDFDARKAGDFSVVERKAVVLENNDAHLPGPNPAWARYKAEMLEDGTVADKHFSSDFATAKRQALIFFYGDLEVAKRYGACEN